MSENNDPNLGAGGYSIGSEDELSTGWQTQDFNILDYVGADDTVGDFDLEQERNSQGHEDLDDTMREKDRYYSALQYNNVVLAPTSLTTTPTSKYMSTPKCSPAHFTSRSTSKNSTLMPNIKVEHEMYDDDQYSNVNEGSEASFGTAKVQPRKYRIKPDSEKKNPQYRQKREKNNDAVRRSRDKAKREQEKKDHRLHELENKYHKLEQINKQLRGRIDMFEEQMITFKQREMNCTCQRR
uniref:BZIP domain-containing protein n=1 Tax=Ditylenchus dipsaci TaxID=166011 RepID=A0A915DIP5_9BILA